MYVHGHGHDTDCGSILPDTEALNKRALTVFMSSDKSLRLAFTRTTVSSMSLGGVLEARDPIVAVVNNSTDEINIHPIIKVYSSAIYQYYHA